MIKAEMDTGFRVGVLLSHNLFTVDVEVLICLIHSLRFLHDMCFFSTILEYLYRN